MIKLIYSYGIPPGSALILVGIIGIVMSLITICIDYTEYLVGRTLEEETEALESSTVEIIVELFVLTELLVHVCLLGYGVVIKGMRTVLKTWIIVSGVFAILWEINLIMLFIEELTRANVRPRIALILAYFILYTAAFYCYELHLAIRCLPLFETIVDLEPIGKGFRFIWDYYKNHPRAAASFALMIEIMLNVHVFLERHVTEYGIGYDYIDSPETRKSMALSLEETFVRYTRVIVCFGGFYLAYKEKRFWMFNWCLAYLATLTVSFGIFVYMIFTWRAVHSLLTLVYFTTFTLNLLFRTGVLYVCVRYTDIYERQGIPL